MPGWVLARARAHTRTPSRRSGVSPTIRRHERLPCDTGWRGPDGGPRRPKVQRRGKKLQKSLAVSKLFRTFATMKPKEPRDAWYVSGRNRLTGMRDQLTGVMPHDEAAARMERYLKSARKQKYPTYTRLRLERAVAVQLTFTFNQNS